MCNALPGQTDCKRAGCSMPINIEPNGRRHPFCSIACARACGEKPRVPAQAMPARTAMIPPPAYNSVGKFNKMNPAYPSPIGSDDSDNETQVGSDSN
ncbi:hypothetical protein BG015_003883 [Linnemannia schmuckeri]|uniref:Uncharacterized protein n=1 Tax=Linnemannia schmuckeri TaxID=64567 RepID=A0A9P5SAK6_9FUNG|nr:hypothetical protein BG015_003883 [Linnemannia schmuckeri]